MLQIYYPDILHLCIMVTNRIHSKDLTLLNLPIDRHKNLMNI